MKATAVQKNLLNGLLQSRTIESLNKGMYDPFSILKEEQWQSFVEECSSITLDFIINIIASDVVTNEDVSNVLKIAVDTFYDKDKSHRNELCQRCVYHYMTKQYSLSNIGINEYVLDGAVLMQMLALYIDMHSQER